MQIATLRGILLDPDEARRPCSGMAKKRSAKSRSGATEARGKKKGASRGKQSARSANSRGSSGDARGRPRADELLDDIELLNVHRWPESMPSQIVAHVRNSRACQRRLEELVKGMPGRRQARDQGFSQLLQEKLDESEDENRRRAEAAAREAREPQARSAPADVKSLDAAPQQRTQQSAAEESGIGDRIADFFRRYF